MPRPDVSIRCFDDEQSLGNTLAREVLTLAMAARSSGLPFLLGCPGGRSLRSTYEWLGRHAAAADADLSQLHVVMMDDYVTTCGNQFVHCPADAHYSCRRFAFEAIRNVINASLPVSRRIPVDQIWLPDAADPAAYDRRIESAGGIDLFLLASGASDGHVAFNPPGASLDSRTRIVALAESTRRDNLATFPAFTSLDDVPSHGVTVGLGTIAMLSRQVVMVMHGQSKRDAAQRLIRCNDFTPDWPASIVYRCHHPRILLDREAADSHETAA